MKGESASCFYPGSNLDRPAYSQASGPFNNLLELGNQSSSAINWATAVSRGNVFAYYPVSLSSNPGRVSFLTDFFWSFPSTIRWMSWNLGLIYPQIPFGHHNHPNHSSSVYRLWWSLASDAVHGLVKKKIEGIF